jgi:hypothetical protein
MKTIIAHDSFSSSFSMDFPESSFIGRLRHVTGEGTEQHDRTSCRKRGRGQLGDTNQDVERRPELRSGRQAHEAGDDRFAGVKCVADGFEVEDRLQNDPECGNPHQIGAVIDGHFRTDDPLAATDGTGEENRPRTDRPQHIPE